MSDSATRAVRSRGICAFNSRPSGVIAITVLTTCRCQDAGCRSGALPIHVERTVGTACVAPGPIAPRAPSTFQRRASSALRTRVSAGTATLAAGPIRASAKAAIEPAAVSSSFATAAAAGAARGPDPPVRAGGADPARRRFDARGGGAAQPGRGRQRDRVPRGPAAKQRRGVRRLTAGHRPRPQAPETRAPAPGRLV